jgi:hypothetical protein
MSTHIYMSEPNFFIQKIWAHWPVPHNGTTKPAHQPNQNGTHKYHTIRGPLRHPPLPLPPEEVVAHPYLPQAVVVDHLLDRPAQVAGGHSSSPLAPQLAAGATAMAATIQHTAPGHPRPGSGSTDALARLAEPSRSGGLHPHPLRLPPAEHAMAPHQGHPNGASAPVSQVLLLPQQPHPSDASHPAVVCPAQAAPVPGPCPPLAHEVLHLHKHQTNNKQRY